MSTNTPLADQIAGRLISTTTRNINNEYHLGLIAGNSEALRREICAIRKEQAGAAILNLRAQMGIANVEVQRHDATNQILSGLAEDLHSLIGQAERMSEQFAAIEDTVACGFQQVNATLQEGFASLVGALNQAVSVLQQQQITLSKIANVLTSPNEIEVQELLRAGQESLTDGAKTDGREHDENWKDALRLFHRVVENDIGKKNYVAWFNIGYLRWKHLGNLAEAEDAFFHGQRLSASSRDLWHTKSLRHIAEMQDKQDKHEDAWLTINRALAVIREYDSLRAAARFAWKTNRRAEAIDLLDECIELVPETIHDMFAEEDFLR